MQPVTGPHVRDFFSGVLGATSAYRRVEGWRQKPPYNISLPYSSDEVYVGYDKGWGFNSGTYGKTDARKFGTRSAWRYGDFPTTPLNQATNKALDRLRNASAPDVLIPAIVAESGKSLKALNSHVVHAVRLLAAVKRRDVSMLRDVFRDISGYRGIIPVKGPGKGFADKTLEWKFGWKPLITDCQSVMELLSSEIPHVPIEASAKVRGLTQREVYVGAGDWYSTRHEYWIKVKVGGRFVLTNPNLYLLDRLGITNPFTSVWEVLPWSFVVDYFVNVGQFVQSLVPMYGAHFEDGWRRTVKSDLSTYSSWTRPGGGSNPLTGSGKVIERRTSCRAVVGLPEVTLTRKEWTWGKDLSRLQTSTALLLQRIT